MSFFSERLRALRIERNLSQAELAEKLRISKSSVNMYERGEREPGFETLEAIADFFNVDMNYLFGIPNTAHLDMIEEKFGTEAVEWVQSGKPFFLWLKRHPEAAAKSEAEDCFASPDERDLLECYRRLPDDAKQYVQDTVRMAMAAFSKNGDK